MAWIDIFISPEFFQKLNENSLAKRIFSRKGFKSMLKPKPPYGGSMTHDHRPMIQ
jgi:hypothetical protein